MPQVVDVLGEKPKLAPPVAYKAPEPTVYKTSEGMTVWLLERPALPLVSMAISVPTGAADDPPQRGGLAHISAGMMDEGAGKRGAIEISDTIADLGADLYASVGHDGSRVVLNVMKRHLPVAFEVFADVVARPTFDDKEYARVHKLWLGGLERRKDNVSSVARVVRAAVLYGAGTPYGHPTSGVTATAKRIGVAAAKDFYQRAWRPDQAQLVVAGAITRAELDALLAKHLGSWTNPSEPALGRIDPPQPLTQRPRLVLVDRPDAPQSVITVIGRGIPASSPDGPALDLINTALGGSFTSRLNQNLREDHGWTYGARSAFIETRGVGPFVASSSVFTNVTAPALREMLSEITNMSQNGLTAEELTKVRARDLTELIETNETIGSLVGRLTSLSVRGMSYDHDAKASAIRQATTGDQLAALAKQYLDVGKMSIIVVGPKTKVVSQLRALELGDPEMWSPEGEKL